MPSGDTGLSRATELFQRKNLLSQEVITVVVGRQPRKRLQRVTPCDGDVIAGFHA